MFVVLVTTGLIDKFSVAIESQPRLLTNVTEYVPPAAYVCAFQEYGNWFEHMLVFVVLVTTGLMVKLSVATESQPRLLTNVTE